MISRTPNRFVRASRFPRSAAGPFCVAEATALHLAAQLTAGQTRLCGGRRNQELRSCAAIHLVDLPMPQP